MSPSEIERPDQRQNRLISDAIRDAAFAHDIELMQQQARQWLAEHGY
jgi:hypothetical protein